MKKVTRVLAAKSGTVLAAVLAIIAGVQLAVLATVYDPYQDGFNNIGAQCASASDPMYCAIQKCTEKYSSSADTCADIRCVNGAIRYQDRTDGNPRDTRTFLSCPAFD